MKQSRIEKRFASLATEGRPALVIFVTGGDPNFETGMEILKNLPEAGADIIEIGMPFSDPMADGPAIQLGGQRALKNGQTMAKTLEMVSQFRQNEDDTPIILMGYYNPIYIYGTERFLDDAAKAGVDGLIIVDLPPEADHELCIPAMERGISFIRLATPTTNAKRLPTVLNNTSGFVYYVSINGITGAAAPDPKDVATAVARIKEKTELPIVVGFGVRTGEQAASIGEAADGVVVGSAIVAAVEKSLDENGNPTDKTVSAVTELVGSLASGVRSVKK